MLLFSLGPVWTTPAAGSTASQSISELITTPEDIYTLAATDEDNSGTLTYTIAPPDNSKFTVVGDKLRAIANGSFDVDAANADRAYTLTVRYINNSNRYSLTIIN